MLQSPPKSLTFRLIAVVINICFMMTFASPVKSWAQSPADLGLPTPGTMVHLTPPYVPVIAKGLRVHPENPILFDFIIDSGNSQLQVNNPLLKSESEKLIKYFLASLTIPEDDQWVNLSPYEKDRIVPEQLGQTELGRDMLAQDYILKQLTASLVYPEKSLGKEFWNRIYAKSQQLLGTNEIPVNTFNKVWITADKADIYVKDNTAFIVNSHLKVMLEEDYLSLKKHTEIVSKAEKTNSVGSQVVREIILPELEKEVNSGKNFTNLRQIFHSMILATWYKKNLKNALLNQVYSNKAKISGVDVLDKSIKEKIYQNYLKAYKKGVFNYIKEDNADGQAVPRKYFSGGIARGLDLDRAIVVIDSKRAAQGLLTNPLRLPIGVTFRADVNGSYFRSFGEDDDSIFGRSRGASDSAMAAEDIRSSHIFFSKYIADPTQHRRLEDVLLAPDLEQFNAELVKVVNWVNSLPASAGTTIRVKDVIVIKSKYDLPLNERVKLTKLNNERRGFYYDSDKGNLYVLQGYLEESIENAKVLNSTAFLGAEIAMSFQNYASIKDPEPDSLYTQLLSEVPQDHGEHKKDKILDDLRQRRHKENLVRGYQFAFSYLETGDHKAEIQAIEEQLLSEWKKQVEDFPGFYESRASLHEKLKKLGLEEVELTSEGNAATKDKIQYAALRDELMTFTKYCAYGRAFNTLSKRIDPTLRINASQQDLEEHDYSKGKRVRAVIWAGALNPESVAHPLLTQEQLIRADQGLQLLTGGDFRKPALLASEPVRRQMTAAVHEALYGGGQVTNIGLMYEPPATSAEEEKFRLNGEEKVREHIVRFNPNAEHLIIDYGAGVDHFRSAYDKTDVLTEANVRDFVYYMAASDYLSILERLKSFQTQNISVIDATIKIVSNIIKNEKDFDKKKALLLNELLTRIKAGEIIKVPKLDTIPKLVLMKKQLADEKKSVDIRLVIALRGGEQIITDPYRDELIDKYGLEVTINDGITVEISSTDIRSVLTEYAKTGHVNQFRLGSLPLSEWPFIFGKSADLKAKADSYRTFLIRYGNPVLPADLEVLEARRAGKDYEGTGDLEVALNNLGIGGNFTVLPSRLADDPGHSLFEVNDPAFGTNGKGLLIRANYSVKCGLDPVTGLSINTFDNFEIGYPNGNSEILIDGQKAKLEGLIREFLEKHNRIQTDKAMLKSFEKSSSPTGGIDLNSSNLQMGVKGQKINMEFDTVILDQFEQGDFSGVRPVIINITPIFNLRPLLGLKEEEPLRALAKA